MRNLLRAPGPIKRAAGWLCCAALALAACGGRPASESSQFSQPVPSEAFATLSLPDLPRLSEKPGEDAPRRIVSLIPSVTELVFALGLGDHLVGRSHWCDWPPEALRLPDLGRFESFSKERIVDLHPDLVILFASQRALAEGLATDFGVRTLLPATEDREAVYQGIAQVAAALGVPRRGGALIDHLRRSLEAVRQRTLGLRRVRTLVVLDRDPLYVPGRGSFVHDLLVIAGAENVAGSLDVPGSWPTVSMERVLEWDPELIIDLSVGEDRAKAIEGGRVYWQRQDGIRAVRTGRVVFLEAGVLVRPGPRMAAAAELLARLVHGE